MSKTTVAGLLAGIAGILTVVARAMNGEGIDAAALTGSLGALATAFGFYHAQDS